MRLLGLIGTALLSLIIAAPVYAQQEQHDQEEQKDKPAHEGEKKAQPEKPAKQEKKAANPEEKNAPQERNAKPTANKAQRSPEAKPEKQAQRGGGRIPADRYKANFGRQHTFRVSAGDYRSHRFQYGGYWFGFADPWPSNWLYTQDVYVVEINGAYYLCNASYPGVNLSINLTL